MISLRTSNLTALRTSAAHLRGRIHCLRLKENVSTAATCRLLAGTGRSGTTWLASLLSRALNLRLIFEPFHFERVSQARALGPRPYVPASSQAHPYLDIASQLLYGYVKNPWTEMHNTQFQPEGRLVKDIRINLMLPAIVDRWPSLPVIVLIRNPLDVAASRQRIGWNQQLELYLNNEELCHNHLQDIAPYLRGLRTYPQIAIAEWCIENFFLVDLANRGAVLMLRYEDILDDPEGQMSRIVQFFLGPGGGAQRGVFDQFPDLSPQKTESKPTTRMLQQDIVVARELLEAFGLETFYEI